MIKPLQNSSLNFKANAQDTTSGTPVMSPILKERLNATSNADYLKFQAQATAKQSDLSESAKKEEKVPFFNKFLSFIKGTNKGLNTVGGAVKGILYAIPATLVSGALFKNIAKNSQDGALSVKGAFGAIGGTIADAASGIVDAGKFLWNQGGEKVGTALANILTSPSKFYKNYMKDYKGLAALASAIGVGVIAFNVVKARLSANKQNSNIDHTFYSEHKA